MTMVFLLTLDFPTPRVISPLLQRRKIYFNNYFCTTIIQRAGNHYCYYYVLDENTTEAQLPALGAVYLNQ